MNQVGWSSSLRERRVQATALGKALSVSVVTQMVSSGTNFLLGLYLVRALSLADYGLYGIGFAVSLFFGGTGNALFLTQMVVNTPDKPAKDRQPYAASMFTAVAIFCVATIGIVGTVLGMVHMTSTKFQQFEAYGAAVTAASVAYLLKEFFVRHSYNVRKENWALAINLALAFTLVTILVIVHTLSATLSVVSALWIYAISQISAAAVGYGITRLQIREVTFAKLLDDVREAWQGGRWATLTNFVYFLKSQAHTIVLAALTGPVGVACLNASRLLITPAVMLTPALSQVLMPRLAALRPAGGNRVIRAGGMITVLLFVIGFSYSCAILLFSDKVVHKVLGAKYQGLDKIILGWCIVLCLLAFSNGCIMILQALKRFSSITLANSVSAFFAIFSVYALVQAFELPGAVYGLAVAELVMIGMIVRTVMSAVEVHSEVAVDHPQGNL